MARPKQANQLRLASRMRELREASGQSGNAFARVLGWVQSRVSKIENAAQIATHEDVDAWVDHLRPPFAMVCPLLVGEQEAAEARAELHDLADAAHSEYQSWQRMYYARGGGARAQEAIASIERATTVNRDFVHAMIPGILQTEAYAREAVAIPGGPVAWGADDEQLKKLVAARRARRAALKDAGREFHFVLGEAALWSRFGTIDTLAEQLEQLAVDATELDSIDLRIMPFAQPWPVFPLATFAIYDDQMVSLESQVGEQNIVDPQQVKAYLTQFELLVGAAFGPAESVALIRDIAARLRADDVGGVR